MGVRDSVLGYYYSIGGSFKIHSALLGDGSYSDMLTPTSGKRIVLFQVNIFHQGTGTNYATSMGFAASGATPSTFFVLGAYNTTDIRPINVCMMSCPPIGDTDQVIRGKVDNAAAGNSYCMLHYTEID